MKDAKQCLTLGQEPRKTKSGVRAAFCFTGGGGSGVRRRRKEREESEGAMSNRVFFLLPSLALPRRGVSAPPHVQCGGRFCSSLSLFSHPHLYLSRALCFVLSPSTRRGQGAPRFGRRHAMTNSHGDKRRRHRGCSRRRRREACPADEPIHWLTMRREGRSRDETRQAGAGRYGPDVNTNKTPRSA